MKIRFCLGSAIGASIAVSVAFGACFETFQFPVPCQDVATAYRCPSGCTTTYSGPTRSNCVGVTDGCCQWRERAFTCSGGSCGSGCAEVAMSPHEYVGYTWMWQCCNLNNQIQDRQCRPAGCVEPPSGGG